MGNCIDGRNTVAIEHKPQTKKPYRPSRLSKARTAAVPSYPSIEDVLREERINRLKTNA